MKTIQKIYAQFAQLLEQEGTGMGFRGACSRLGVAPADLDEYLLEELGMTGEEYMASLDK